MMARHQHHQQPQQIALVVNAANNGSTTQAATTAAATATATAVAAPATAAIAAGGSAAGLPIAAAMQTLTLDEVEKKHSALCQELNMDEVAARESWQQFASISAEHKLEGEPMHWLSCSLYIACRSVRVPTVGQSGATVEGNCVSLTQLLRACKITFLEFFHKMEHWMELVGSPRAFRGRIERLKQNLLVSLLVYDKYQKIFKDLFVGLQADEARKRKKIAATTPCSSRKLYDFCWYLFLCAKSEYPENSVDLVTTFHMLLCCVDLVFANIVADRRSDLVNSRLYTDPQWNTDELLQPQAAAANDPSSPKRRRICTMALLCKLYDGTLIDALETKQYAWTGVVRKFIAANVLRGDAEHLGLLTVENFDHNLNGLMNMYKAYFLSVGEIDEGILLTQVENSTMTQNLKRQTDESKKQMMPPTPLTRRFCLPSKEAHPPGEPVAMATRSVHRLRDALGVYDPVPPPSLAELLRLCPEDPVPKMKQILSHMSTLFCARFETNAKERFELAEMLYYRLLENIVRREQATQCNFDYKILRHDIFHTTLITCSVEIVIHAYMGQKRFPWVLECFSVEAYHFYKIIEMIVLNHGDILTRDSIKHLNAIEEKCIDSLVWRSQSPLWDQINQCERLPERQDADIPKQLQHHLPANGTPQSAMARLLQSPIDVTERFNAETPNGHVAKQLFKPATTPPSAAVAAAAVAPSNPASGASAAVGAAAAPAVNPRQSSAICPGSMKLFFRKFYKLAYLRMIEICRHLNYLNDQYMQKIWTIFEYSITKESELMRDRHLDQILMCAIYVFGRNGKFQTTFKDIMLSYRKQPQTTSDVYRDVHMTEADIAFEREPPVGAAAAAVQVAAAAGAEPKKYDIISFYNFCYVRSMQEFVMSTKEDGMLSPLPSYASAALMSPRKVHERHSLYIQPFEPRELPQSPNAIAYSFRSSPVDSQAYSKIQRILAQAQASVNSHGKRELPFERDAASSAAAADAPNGGIFKMSRTMVVGGVGGGANGAHVSAVATAPTERVPYIREKLQKIITDRQGNN